MGLKIGSGRDIFKWGLISVFAILFLVFFLKTAIWEKNYYDEKEGSQRAISLNFEEELVEIPPSESEVIEYKVAADRPRYLSIDSLGISNARVLPMGINAAGELSTPNNIFDVGWYYNSSKPGQGGTLLIDGHNGGPHVQGVFKALPALSEGDIIVIERGDGKKFKYSVVENVAVSLSDSNDYMATAMRTPMAGKESVTLISCAGEWSDQQKTYMSRQFVRAILVD
jgi:sortase (surface protein transpeptidase)